MRGLCGKLPCFPQMLKDSEPEFRKNVFLHIHPWPRGCDGAGKGHPGHVGLWQPHGNMRICRIWRGNRAGEPLRWGVERKRRDPTVCSASIGPFGVRSLSCQRGCMNLCCFPGRRFFCWGPSCCRGSPTHSGVLTVERLSSLRAEVCLLEMSMVRTLVLTLCSKATESQTLPRLCNAAHHGQSQSRSHPSARLIPEPPGWKQGAQLFFQSFR